MFKLFKKKKNEIQVLKKELEILRTLYLKVNVNMNLNEVLDEIIFTFREKIDFDGCNISLIDDDGYMRIHKIDLSKISKKSKLTEKFLNKIYSQKLDFENSNNWACVAAREREEIYFPDISKKSFSDEEQQLLNNYGITSLYYLPIFIGNKTFGTLRFHNYMGTMYLTDFEKELIRGRVAIIARALENVMLYNSIKKNNEIIKLDLELANRIQQNLLPQVKPKIDQINIVTVYKPMLEVGGDYFDFLFTREKKESFGVIITDATGHGIPAAFITSMVKMSFQNDSIRKNITNPAKLLSNLNSSLLGKIAENFVTGLYCFFDLEDMVAKISCAGHNPLFYIKKDSKKVVEINPKGKALALIENLQVDEISQQLNPGDRFFLYTDGLTEASDKKGKFFEEQLINILESSSDLSADELSNLINHKLKEHSLYNNRESFDDDIAFIIIDIKDN